MIVLDIYQIIQVADFVTIFDVTENGIPVMMKHRGTREIKQRAEIASTSYFANDSLIQRHFCAAAGYIKKPHTLLAKRTEKFTKYIRNFEWPNIPAKTSGLFYSEALLRRASWYFKKPHILLAKRT